MLDIRTRIRTDLNPSKWIRFRIRSENIRTVFIPSADHGLHASGRMQNNGLAGVLEMFQGYEVLKDAYGCEHR